MADTFNVPRSYRIEISGWGLDDIFFVEQTDLLWSRNGKKQVLLHRAIPEGAMIFVRLLSQESAQRPVPVPYQVEGVQPMDCNGQCEMRLTQLYPRSKEPNAMETASYVSEGSLSLTEPKASSTTQREPEEMLR